jgi:hypothetical protein
MSRERSEERSTGKRLVRGVAGVQELQNKNLRNRAPRSGFLNAVFSEKSGNGCIYDNTFRDCYYSQFSRMAKGSSIRFGARQSFPDARNLLSDEPNASGFDFRSCEHRRGD